MFNLNYDTLKKRANKEDWQYLKSQYQNEIREDLQNANYDIPEDIDLNTLNNLRLDTLFKSYKLLAKSINDTLPSELNKIKQITNMLCELNKILNQLNAINEEENKELQKYLAMDESERTLQLMIQENNNRIKEIYGNNVYDKIK